MIEIKHNEQILAIIIFSNYKKNGIHFFTPNNFSQQLAYMNRPAGYEIEPHVHNKVSRSVIYTQETLFIRKGKVRVDFFTQEKDYLKSIELSTGDVILLAGGGHGFTMLEQTEMIEVKQGPFAGDNDKIRFKKNG
jgi:hypothetical protein